MQRRDRAGRWAEQLHTDPGPQMLAAPAAPQPDDAQGKARIAREAREQARLLRDGKPVTFRPAIGTHQPPPTAPHWLDRGTPVTFRPAVPKAPQNP